MEIGPMCCDLQPPSFGGDQGVFVSLGSCQGAGDIQLHQIIFEHTFNIWLSAATPPDIRRPRRNGQHHANPDNTTQGRDHACDTRRSKYLRSIGFVTSSRARWYAAVASLVRPLLRSRSALAA